MDNRIASAPIRAALRAGAVMVVAAILAAVAASDVVAQTPPAPTGAPIALPRSFPAPDVSDPSELRISTMPRLTRL
jgi:hypothetical protein